MAAVKPSIKDILWKDTKRIGKSYEMEDFVMDHHAYK